MRLIDADALKEDIDNLRLFKKWIREEIKTHIDNAPTVKYPFYQEAYQTGYEEGKNERPQGEWKYIGSYANTHIMRYECSKCGRIVDVYKSQELLPVCHCGADMRKGEVKGETN